MRRSTPPQHPGGSPCPTHKAFDRAWRDGGAARWPWRRASARRLAVGHHQDRDPLPARRLDRRDRAAGAARPAAAARRHHHHREPAGRLGQRRNRDGRRRRRRQFLGDRVRQPRRNPFVLPSMPYNTEKDLDPVLLIGTAPYVVSTHPQKPFNTLADVIARQDQARHGELRLGRQRQHRPPRHGAAVRNRRECGSFTCPIAAADRP